MLFSLKKLSKISLTIALFLAIFVILGNFILMPIVNKYIDGNEILMNNISFTYQDLGYQLNILNNIHQTVNRDEEKKISDTMASAYERNTEKTLQQLAYLKAQLTELNTNLDLLHRVSLPFRTPIILSTQELIAEMNARIDQFDLTKLNGYDLVYMEKLLEVYDHSEDLILSLLQDEMEDARKLNYDN